MRWRTAAYWLLPPLRGAATLVQTVVSAGLLEAHVRLAPEASRDEIIARHVHRWSIHLLKTYGVNLELRGLQAGERVGPQLVVANHRSPFDIPILLSLFGGSFLSRADVADWPVFGAGARRAGTVFVDRASRSSGANAVRALRGRLGAGGTVVVFPEGTTYAGDEVREFRAGAFAAVREIDAEVIPVGLAYPPGFEWVNHEPLVHYAKRVAAVPRVRVGVCVGPSLRSVAATGELAVQARSAVQQATAEARRLQQEA